MNKRTKTNILLLVNVIFCVAVAVAVSAYPPPGTMTKFAPPDERLIRRADWQGQACLGVSCGLCPFRCFLPEGSRGICRVRMNVGGELKTLVYGQPASVHIDPIEKKPVYHMLPGSQIFSIATIGCNLRCRFCQNWEISQCYPEEAGAGGRVMTPEEVVDAAAASGCNSIAYTYSEPVVFYEYMLDTAKLAKARGLRNVMVGAGYINRSPLKEIAPYFDVIKIDLKGFNERFYRDVVGGDLGRVLDTLKTLHSLGVFTEVVNLVIPGLNDNLDEIRDMCRWIYDNLGADTPVFFSRFAPQYRLGNLPPTPVETLELARETAMKAGLRYAYIGNVPGHPGENTYCPDCGKILVRRYGYSITENNLKGGRCASCGNKIPGIWSDE
jgi:pyruvate formate lyase activating enzyme